MPNLTETIRDSFIQYSGAVLQSRALVDVRDCLKPSTRQIFYCMHDDGFVHSKPYQKTLKSIASAFKVYLHGDSSCEGIIMRSAQPFAMRYPLVEVEGSFGNLIESGNWAAPRYTASRLSPLSEELFCDLKKETISEWRDNYDDTIKYPAVLPTKGFYNIVNGSFGIGIGAQSSIPAFNLFEVNKALIKLLENPNCSFEEIYCAPDFPTGCTLMNESQVKESLRNGTGNACILRATIDYDAKDNCLIVKEIPYGVYTNTICKELEAILEDESNNLFERFNDLTGASANIKIYLSKNVNPERAKNYLYKNTSLQSYFGINFTMLDKGRFPKVFTWKEALQAHLNHEREVYIKGFNYDLKKINDRLHIIHGLLIAINNIDEVIKIIKESSSPKAELKDKFSLDDIQIKAILDMKLSQIAKLEMQKLVDEKDSLNQKKEQIEKILADEFLLRAEIKNGLQTVANKYKDARRTIIKDINIDAEEVIPVEPEKCVVILTKGGYIKRVPSDSFKPQNRNTKGAKNEDYAISTIKTNTVDTLMIFSNQGNVYRLLVDSISDSPKGEYLKTLIGMPVDEEPTTIYSFYKDSSAKYILFITKNGIVKKTPVEEYTSLKKTVGIKAIKLKENDSLVAISLITNEQIILVTKSGMNLRFNSTDITPTARFTIGVKGINLKAEDKVVAALTIRDPNDAVALFSESGKGVRYNLSDVPLQNKGGKGVIGYKDDKIVGALLVSNIDLIYIAGKKNSVCIAAKDIPLLNRGGIGSILIKGNSIASVGKI